MTNGTLRTVSVIGGDNTVHPAKLPRIVRDAVIAAGPDASFESVAARLAGDGYPCPKACYEEQYARSFGDAPPDEHADTFTKLQSFISFAGAVERCGGVARARHYLDLLEKLKGTL